MKEFLEQEFEAVLSRNAAIIYKVCRFYYNDLEDIDDLFQEITIRLWKGFKTMRKEAKESTWIYRVALNTAINFDIKDKSNLKLVELPAAWTDSLMEQEDDDLIKQLFVIIEQLHPVERSVILLYLDGKSHQEIAEIVGYSTTNVGTKIQRIKEKMIKINKTIL